MMRQTYKPSGFSLVELLICLFIIGVLSALLLPPLAQARNQARQATCLSNVRQMAGGLAMYVADYDGAYPSAFDGPFDSTGHTKIASGHSWHQVLKPYTGNQGMICPGRYVPFGFQNHIFLSGYALNHNLNEKQSLEQARYKPVGRAENQVNQSSLAVAFFDSRALLIASDRPDTNENFAEADSLYPGKNKDLIRSFPPGATRHNGGANYAFCDGHARWLKPDSLAVGAVCDGVHPGFGL